MLAGSIGKSLDTTAEQVEVYAYGLEILLGIIVKTTVIIGAGYWLGILDKVLVFLASFTAFRCFGGGVHLSTYNRCLTAGSLIILGLSYLAATADWSQQLTVLVYLLTLLWALFAVVKWVPAGTEKKRFIDKQIINMQKRNMFISILLWTIVMAVLISQALNQLALALVLGGTASLFLISPAGYKVMGSIDYWLDSIKGGE